MKSSKVVRLIESVLLNSRYFFAIFSYLPYVYIIRKSDKINGFLKGQEIDTKCLRMKNEAEFNGIVVKSLNQSGWAYKVPDQVSLTTGFGAPKPFDIVGIYKDINGVGRPVYIESKFLHRVESFNFSRLEDHQIEALSKCQNLLGENALVLLLICVDFGRAEKRVYFYKDMKELQQRKNEKKSILKKEFESSQNFTIIKKGLINFEDILNG